MPTNLRPSTLPISNQKRRMQKRVTRRNVYGASRKRSGPYRRLVGGMPGDRSLLERGIAKGFHCHVSLVKFCEVRFGIKPLNARSEASDDLSECFDFTQPWLPPS